MSIARADIESFYNIVVMIANHVNSDEAQLPSQLIDVAKEIRKNYRTFLEGLAPQEQKATAAQHSMDRLKVQIPILLRDFPTIIKVAQAINSEQDPSILTWESTFKKIATDIVENKAEGHNEIMKKEADEIVEHIYYGQDSTASLCKVKVSLFPLEMKTGGAIKELTSKKEQINDLNKQARESIAVYKSKKEQKQRLNAEEKATFFSLGTLFSTLIASSELTDYERENLQQTFDSVAYYSCDIYLSEAIFLMERQEYVLCSENLAKAQEYLNEWQKTIRENHVKFFSSLSTRCVLLTERSNYLSIGKAIAQIRTDGAAEDLSQSQHWENTRSLLTHIATLKAQKEKLQRLEPTIKAMTLKSLCKSYFMECSSIQVTAHYNLAEQFKLFTAQFISNEEVSDDFIANVKSYLSESQSYYMQALAVFDNRETALQMLSESDLLTIELNSKIGMASLLSLEAEALVTNGDLLAGIEKAVEFLNALNAITLSKEFEKDDFFSDAQKKIQDEMVDAINYIMALISQWDRNNNKPVSEHDCFNLMKILRTFITSIRASLKRCNLAIEDEEAIPFKLGLNYAEATLQRMSEKIQPSPATLVTKIMGNIKDIVDWIQGWIKSNNTTAQSITELGEKMNIFLKQVASALPLDQGQQALLASFENSLRVYAITASLQNVPQYKGPQLFANHASEEKQTQESKIDSVVTAQEFPVKDLILNISLWSNRNHTAMLEVDQQLISPLEDFVTALKAFATNIKASASKPSPSS